MIGTIIIFLKLQFSLAKRSRRSKNQNLRPAKLYKSTRDTPLYRGSKFKIRIGIKFRNINCENRYQTVEFETNAPRNVYASEMVANSNWSSTCWSLLVNFWSFDQKWNLVFNFQPKRTLNPIISHKFWIADATCCQISSVLHAIDVIPLIHCCWSQYFSWLIGHKGWLILSLLVIHCNKVVQSVSMKLPLKLHSSSLSNICFNLILLTAAISSSFGIVSLFIGATLALRVSKPTWP